MPNVFQGQPSAARGRYAIVVARYNETITTRLLEGALATLQEHGVEDGAIDIAWVPGAFEIPLIAARMAESGNYQAVICLGAVIKGETTHDEHINRAVSLELTRLGVACRMPVMFGVLTCNSLEQAIHRAGGNVGNKGSECALAALEMVSLLEQL